MQISHTAVSNINFEYMLIAAIWTRKHSNTNIILKNIIFNQFNIWWNEMLIQLMVKKLPYFFCGFFMFLFCLVFAMSLCASVYMCFVVTCLERADLLALVCGVCCEFVTFPLVSWVRCGTWLYRFLIFAPLLTLTSFVVSNVRLSLSYWYPGSNVVLDCIDIGSLYPHSLSFLEPVSMPMPIN